MTAASLTAPSARTGRVQTAAASLAVGAALVGAIVLAVVSARHASPSAVSPVTPRGAWNGIWVTCVVASFVLYGVGWLLARSGRIRLGAALTVAVLVQAVPLAAPLLLSKDVFLYWGEARVFSTHDANPYRSSPADFPGDPSFPWVSESWRDKPAPYGPGWELASVVPAAIGGSSHVRAELAYRAVAALALLASIALVARRTRSAASVAFLGWSPLLALHYAGGGHSDAVMMLALLGAVAGGTTALGGALWPIASSFKPVAPVLLPLELARRRLHVGRSWWIGLVGATAAVLVGATALFGTHWVRSATTGASDTSALGGVHWLSELGLRHRYAVLVAALAFACVYLVLLRSAWRTGRARLSLAATALCLTSSLLRPWYALWPVALAALEEDALATAAAFALTGYLLFGDAVSL